MATTITQSFIDYKSNLEITDYQTCLVSRRRENVVSALGAELTLHPTQRSLLSGSWCRRTITRYLSEGDVDVMVVLHDDKLAEWYNAAGTVKALDRFRDILKAAYPNTPLRRDRNCVTMRFSEFRLDVVPSFLTATGAYAIPDSIRCKWVLTNPFKFAEKITSVNRAMNGSFVPLIKMVKGWNREQDWPIRSFHLECLLYAHHQFSTSAYNYSYMLKGFFEVLPTYLAHASHDPVLGDRVDTYLDGGAAPSRRQIAIRKAKAAATLASAACTAEKRGQIETAIRTWKSLLGEFFPAYG